MTVFSDVSSVITAIRTAWQNDADILSFCQENYGSKPFIFIGMDEQNPPQENYYPIIAALEFRTRGGGSSGRTIYEIEIGCGVLNKNIETDETNRTFIYTGVFRAEKLRTLAFDALVKNNFGKITVKGDTGQASNFPMFISGMTVSIEVINSNRRI